MSLTEPHAEPIPVNEPTQKGSTDNRDDALERGVVTGSELGSTARDLLHIGHVALKGDCRTVLWDLGDNDDPEEHRSVHVSVVTRGDSDFGKGRQTLTEL